MMCITFLTIDFSTLPFKSIIHISLAQVQRLSGHQLKHDMAGAYRMNRLPYETCIIWKPVLSYYVSVVVDGRWRLDEYERKDKESHL